MIAEPAAADSKSNRTSRQSLNSKTVTSGSQAATLADLNWVVAYTTPHHPVRYFLRYRAKKQSTFLLGLGYWAD